MSQRRRRVTSDAAPGSSVIIPNIITEEQTSGIAPQTPSEEIPSGEKPPRSDSPSVRSVSPDCPGNRNCEQPIVNRGQESTLERKGDNQPVDEGIAMENYGKSVYPGSPPQGIAELEATEAVVQPVHSIRSQDPNTLEEPPTLPHSSPREERRRSPENLGWSTTRNITPPPKYSRNPEPRGRSLHRVIEPSKPLSPISDAETRIWTGIDSRLKLKAKFINFDGSYVRLVESDGGETIIFASKLSQPDLDYIESLRTKQPVKQAEKSPELVKTVKFDDSKDMRAQSRKAILGEPDAAADGETVRPERPEILTGKRSKWRPVWRYRKSQTIPRRRPGFSTNDLPLAASQGNLKKVKRLLEEGAFVDWDGEDKKDSESNRKYTARTTTGLYRAAKAGHLEVAQLLLDYGADVDSKAVLKVVAGIGDAAMTRLLLEYGADTERPTSSSDYCTALHVATENGNKAVVEALLEFGADIEARDNNNETALYHAAMKNRCQIAKMLLREGADTTAIAEDGQTALYKAGGRGYEEMVRALLNYGANPSIGRGVSGETVLYKAARKGYTEVVYLLLQYGADPNLSNDTKDWQAGSTMDTIIWLLRPEESPRNVYGQCPLYTAAEQGRGEIVGMLLNCRAEVNAKTKKGDTALYAAAGKAHKDVVSMLLKHGATLAPQQEVDIVTKLMDPNNQEWEEVKNVQTPKRMEIISMLLSRMSTKRILRGLETWRNGESIPGLDMIADTIRKLGV
jgi:ankyrin repeat protein